MVLTRDDMRQHSNGAITDAIIERIFSGAVMRTTPSDGGRRTLRAQPTETIGFEDFVAFLLAEEDKKHPTRCVKKQKKNIVFSISKFFIFSIEYWFRILDLDGDGVISLYEVRMIAKKICIIQHFTKHFKQNKQNFYKNIRAKSI